MIEVIIKEAIKAMRENIKPKPKSPAFDSEASKLYGREILDMQKCLSPKVVETTDILEEWLVHKLSHKSDTDVLPASCAHRAKAMHNAENYLLRAASY